MTIGNFFLKKAIAGNLAFRLKGEILVFEKGTNRISPDYAEIVDVRYFGDGLFNFEWAFKKLPKSIPEALKKDLGLG